MCGCVSVRQRSRSVLYLVAAERVTAEHLGDGAALFSRRVDAHIHANVADLATQSSHVSVSRQVRELCIYYQPQAEKTEYSTTPSYNTVTH